MLEDMFGSGYLENLSVLGEDSTEMSILAEKYIFAPFWEKLKWSEVPIQVTSELTFRLECGSM